MKLLYCALVKDRNSRSFIKHDSIIFFKYFKNLKKGASVETVDVEGRNALDFAIDYYHEDVVEEILKRPSWKDALSNAIG